VYQVGCRQGRASVAFELLTTYWLAILIKVEDSRMDDL
jgi:hypothetical protein